MSSTFSLWLWFSESMVCIGVRERERICACVCVHARVCACAFILLKFFELLCSVLLCFINFVKFLTILSSDIPSAPFFHCVFLKIQLYMFDMFPQNCDSLLFLFSLCFILVNFCCLSFKFLYSFPYCIQLLIRPSKKCLFLCCVLYFRHFDLILINKASFC